MKPGFLFTVVFFFLTISFLTGQESNKKTVITGVVTDEFRNPVQGATITMDGKKSTKTTDKDGKYKIKINASVARIGIFTTPPLSIEETINGRTTINFTLDSAEVKEITSQRNSYGEEEVNVGYGTEKRKNLTTSVSKVDAKQQRYASYSSIYELLRGEVPGVVIDGTRILIRENTSMMSSNEPLFVVDGVPTNSIDGIQPQMVRRIEVLKGSAASIYGSRGSNGVIIISLSDPKKK
jgi:TonB-dependent SusC/RagA subfamily outer membrane receptor